MHNKRCLVMVMYMYNPPPPNPGFYGVIRDCVLGDPGGGGGSGSWTTPSPHLEHMFCGGFLNLNPTFICLKQNQISRFLSNGDFLLVSYKQNHIDRKKNLTCT